MRKKKKDYTIILRILFIVFFLVFAFIIYNTAAQRNVQYLKALNEGRPPVIIQQNIPKKINLQTEKFKFKYSYILSVNGTVKSLTLKVPIPPNEAGKQIISNLQISYKPDTIVNDGVNKIAEFTFKNLSNEKRTVTFEGYADLQSYNLENAQAVNKNSYPEDDLSKYLKPELYVESDDSMIKRISGKIKGSTPEEIIHNIYEYTQKSLTYTYIQGISGAKKALNDKKGKCSEYSAVMIALCRAKNIPARVVTGNIAREKNTKHNWVEVYFDKYGWVTFDPTVMPTVVNIYNNGQLVRQEKRLAPFAASAKYIISARNQFSPYFVSYSVADNKNGRASVEEIIEIHKVK